MKTNLAAAVAAILVVLVALTTRGPALAAARQDATPAITYSCDDATPAAASSMMDHGSMGTPMAEMDHAGMDMGSPMASPMAGMNVEFDQMYIDMMIPHHASIIAMAQAALDRLEDERLREIARRIVETQSSEIDELRGYREDFYGDPEPVPMDESMMGMMQEMMPGMPGSMDDMARQMDPAAQVAAICAAENPDLAFIDMTIVHHESAIAASEAALHRATHDEIRAFAERVIEDQRREIDELTAIRGDLTAAGTPAASPSAVRYSWLAVEHVGGPRLLSRDGR